jgi:cytochrome c553
MPERGQGSRAHAAAATAMAACALAGTAFAQQAQQAQTPPPNAPAQQAAAQQAPAQQAPAPPAAAPAALQGDAQRGKAISYTCLGCHGIDGYRNAYPNYSVPKLKGQNPQYLAAALHGYRDGDRSHLTMHAQASTLSDQDIADIAAYFSGQPLIPGGKAPAPVPQAAQLCTSCHGQDGVAIVPMYPSLAGQHEDYIERALDEYQRGGRKNPIMKGFAANLKDADIAVIAAYFSSLTPSLSTESRPYTRFTAE